MSDREPDEWWDDDDLLESPEDLPWEPEGPPSDDENLDDLDDLLEGDDDADGVPLPDEDALGEPDSDERLDDLDDLLEPADLHAQEWIQETDPPPEPTTPALPRERSRSLPWRSTPAPPTARVESEERVEPITIGYRVPVDLPEHGIRNLPGRCHTQRATSVLRIPMRGQGRQRMRLAINGLEVTLPLLDLDGDTAVRLRLSIAGREVHATLRLLPSDAGVRLLLGRDVLAAGRFVVDVTRADS
ncbi:MAG: hypothetical protein H6739_13210 [Alphaproteobacteria bacterium]|nr:hypothetical protein [Alphaproteobacteria bacterium]